MNMSSLDMASDDIVDESRGATGSLAFQVFDITSWRDYTSAVVRTQIQLTEQQARRLRARAREQGLSLAEVIRRYVEQGLANEGSHRSARYERASKLIGRYRDTQGARDVSVGHDRYLDDAFE